MISKGTLWSVRLLGGFLVYSSTVVAGDQPGPFRTLEAARKSASLVVAFSPDGRTLACSAIGFQAIQSWDVRDGKSRPDLQAGGSVLGFAHAHSGSMIAIAREDGMVVLKGLNGISDGPSLVGHVGRARHVAFSFNDLSIATTGDDATVRVWDSRTGKEKAKLLGHVGASSSAAFSPDGKTLASTGREGSVKIWDPIAGRERATLLGHVGGSSGAAFSPDGRSLATGGIKDHVIRIWDPASGREQRSLAGHEGSVWGLEFSPDGTLIASYSRDGTVRLWDPSSGTCLHTFRDHKGPVTSAAFAPNGKILASAGMDGRVCIREVP
jgi:WD40 repeat protein